MARPERIDAVLFDFDGTLCDTERHNLVLVRKVLEQLDVPISEEELHALSGGDDRVVVPPILERYGSPYTIDDYERLRDHCYRTYSEADLELEPGARELLAGLRGRGVAVGLVSTTIARCVLTALNRLRATDLFDVMVFGDMVTRCKPDPEPYRRALEFLGVDAAHAVVFEDSSTGVAAGQAAGCHTFGCTRCAIGQDLSCADELIDTFVGLRL